MDRISALRNVEDALAAFEEGDLSLSELEREVRGVLRTYATDFEGELRAYRATGDDPAAGTIVLAPGAGQARERVQSLLGVDDIEFDIEEVEATGE